MWARNLILCAAALVLFTGAAVAQYNTQNYQAQGGADWEVGGKLNIKTGGKLTFNGVSQMGAHGEQALGGTNPTAITTGLTTVTACGLALKVSTAPGVNTTTLTYTSSGGTLNVYAWKPTSSSNPTLIASTGTETFGYICDGT